MLEWKMMCHRQCVTWAQRFLSFTFAPLSLYGIERLICHLSCGYFIYK